MANEASSLKKVAVLTGLTMVIGGAEVSETKAATVGQTALFNFIEPTPLPPASPGTGTPFSPDFAAASPPPGTTLTEVDVILDSTINFPVSTTATVTFPGGSFTAPTSTAGNQSFDGSISFTDATDLALYMTKPSFSLSIISFCEGGGQGSCTWSSDSGETGEQSGLTLEYTFTPTTTATPLPGALPLFSTGLAALGLGAWRRRRKQNRA